MESVLEHVAAERESPPIDDTDILNESEPAAEQAEAPAETPLPEHVRQHYEAIVEMERDVRELERNFISAKSAAKWAKEQFEEADAKLRDMIAHGPDRQLKLPLGKEAEPPPQDHDAWKSAPLDALEIADSIKEKLREINVETIGQLEQLRADIADSKAVWPKGIGVAKITAIEDAIIGWLSEHRDSWGKPEEPQDEESPVESDE